MTQSIFSNSAKRYYKLYELCSSGAMVTWRTITVRNQNTTQAGKMGLLR